MFMKRDVLDKVCEKPFTLDWRCGEDIAFCVEAKEKGVKIYCDGAYRLGHLGMAPIVTEKVYLKYQEEHPDEFGEKIPIALDGVQVG